MMMMKRLISLSLGVLLCLILTNCGSDNDNEKESTDPNIEFKIDLSAFTTSGTIFEAALIGKDYIENEMLVVSLTLQLWIIILLVVILTV